ncbi:MAG: colanic acid biosynthesis acetyltransferase WcaF [Ferrimonas sp.]
MDELNSGLNIARNRKTQKYSWKVQLLRVLWGIGRLFFKIIPRPFYGIRNQILILFGAKLGRHVRISNSALIYFPWNLTMGDYSAIGDRVYLYNLGKICIGRCATVSHCSHLCAGSHNYRDASLPLITPPIEIGDNAWVCAGSFIGPKVTLATGAIVGAGSVVMQDVPPWSIVAGNPAQWVKARPQPQAQQ